MSFCVRHIRYLNAASTHRNGWVSVEISHKFEQLSLHRRVKKLKNSVKGREKV